MRQSPTRQTLRLILLGVVVWCAGTASSAQAPGETAASAPSPKDGVPVFRSRSDLVVLHVNVFNGRSGVVSDLPQSAFQVYEDGVPQRIEFFNDHTVPVATGLIIDNSSSTMTRRSMVSAGVKAFATSSRASDEMFTIVFNEHVRFGLPGGVPFTENRALLQASFERYRPGGMTALHDAVVEGLAHLETATLQKRALVVLSDGDDNASRQSEGNMLYRAARSQALIYTIWTGDLTASEEGNRGLLRKLATRSGGIAFEPETEGQVVDAFSAIAGNIRRVYSIGYAPTNTARDGTYRRVKVLVRVPGRNYTVSTREGYTAGDDAERH